jgi:uroporphyrinogen-III synthase
MPRPEKTLRPTDRPRILERREDFGRPLGFQFLREGGPQRFRLGLRPVDLAAHHPRAVGRELLGDTLTARGARIEYAECYRRGKPAADTGPLLSAWARGELDAIVVTSSEGLRNLFDMVGTAGQTWLKKTPLVVPHARIAETARALGLPLVVEAEAGDEGIVAGLVAYFESREHSQH